MSNLVLVRSSMRTWDLALLLVAGIGVCAGGWFAIEHGEKAFGWVLQVAGAVIVAASLVGMVWRKARRQWVRLNPAGFTVIDRSGESDYEDALVRSLALRLKQNYSEGVEKSVTRTLLIWVADNEDDDEDLTTLEFKTTYKSGTSDPLSGLISRLSKQVVDRARELLSHGRTFTGDGWVLERKNLVIAARPEPLHCPLDDIVMTGVVDQKLCLWRRGLDEVWARVDIDTLNAYVLMWLIDERLAERPQEATGSDGGLGRVIFERKSRTTTVIILLLGMFTLFLLGVGLIIGGLVERRNADLIGLVVAGVGALLGSVACFLGILHCRRSLFRCHEYGLVKRGLFGERRLRYEHVDAFTYQATRHFHNGVYTGTVLMLDFEPNGTCKSQRIRYGVTLRQVDQQLDDLRDQVAGIIGQRMGREVIAGGTVKWTPALTFQGDSLVYTPLGFLGRKPPLVIPLAEIQQYKFDQGQCQLFRTGHKKAVIHENMDSRNFFPGFHCLLTLVSTALADEDLDEVETLDDTNGQAGRDDADD